MHITIDSTSLAGAVSWTVRAVPARPSAPILGGIQIHADSEQLKLSAFDYETSARTTIPAPADAAGGTILVPGRPLADICRKAPAGTPITLGANEHTVTLTYPGAEYTLPLLPASEYPSLPDPPKHLGTTPTEDLDSACRALLPATAQALGVLDCIHLQASAGRLVLDATDRYRHAVRDIPWTGEPFEALVPATVLAGIAKGLPRGTNVAIGVDTGQITLQAETHQASSRLQEGKWPPLQKIWARAEDYACTAAVDTGTLRAAIERVSPTLPETQHLQLALRPTTITLTGENHSGVSGREDVPAEITGETDLKINARHLLDGLASVASTTVRINITPAPNRAYTIRSVNPDDSTARYLGVSIKS